MSETGDDCYLFDLDEVNNLDWSNIQSDCKEKLDSNSLILRPLKIDDYDRGHVKLLSQLTKVGDVSKKQFEERFRLMKSCRLIKVVVAVDSIKDKIVGTATLLCEPKFIHDCSWVGHVQEVCVDEAYRGKGLGKIIVNCLKLLALRIGAYKVGLDCADDKVGFYTGLGFRKEDKRANYMVCRYHN